MKTKPLGLHTHRFKDNPEEKRFADAWTTENERGHILAHLLDPHHGTGGRRPPEPERPYQIVAATVMQWLGSSVGQGFLRDLGYEKKVAR